MSSFFSWDLVWEYFPKILSALPDVDDCGDRDAGGSGARKPYRIHAGGKNTDRQSAGRRLCFIHPRDTDSCPAVCRLLRCAESVAGDPD